VNVRPLPSFSKKFASPVDFSVSPTTIGQKNDELRVLNRLLKKSKKQIPHWLKPVRDDKFKGLASARLKPCPFKAALKSTNSETY
jgi:hypothetical protein